MSQGSEASTVSIREAVRGNGRTRRGEAGGVGGWAAGTQLGSGFSSPGRSPRGPLGGVKRENTKEAFMEMGKEAFTSVQLES